MTATYTWDIFQSLDGYGEATDDWGGYWGKQGPELLEHRKQLFEHDMRMVFGAKTFTMFAEMRENAAKYPDVLDPWGELMHEKPMTVISTTMSDTLGWPDATIDDSGDAVAIVRKLKETSPVPLRSHGSLSLNRDLMAAGLVDFLQVTIFPALTGKTGSKPIFANQDDFDLEMVESRRLDAGTQELIYRPTLRRPK